MQVELHKYMELSADFSDNAPYVLVGTGALILFIGTLACCCTVKGQPSLLYLYGGFLAVVLVIEIGMAMSIYAYKDRLADGFDRGLNQSMAQYGIGSAAKTADFDRMQEKLHCCGINSFKDWDVPPNPRPVPRSCCINYRRCDITDSQQIYTQGCFSKVVDFLETNMNSIGAVALGVAFFPLLGAILSCCLAGNINKAKYEQMA